MSGAFAYLLFLAASQAQADVPALVLTWNAPRECPTRQEVMAEVGRILAGGLDRAEPAVAQVDVTPFPAGRWQAIIGFEARGVRGERRFEAESCPAVASASALIIAVAMERGFLQPPAPATVRAQGAPPVPAARTVPGPTTLPPAGHADGGRSSRLTVAVAGLVDGGTMPNAPAAGVEAGLGWDLARARWRFRALAAAAYFPPQTTIGARPSEGGRFQSLAASARGCIAVARGRFDAGPCLGAELTEMRGTGVGPAATFAPASATGTWLSALGGAVGRWSFSRSLAAFARLEATARLAGQRFVLAPGDVVVHRPTDVAGRGALGFELRFF